MDVAHASLPGALALQVPVLQQLRFDTLDLYPVPLDRDGDRLDLLVVLSTLALDGKGDLRIPLAPDFLYGFLHRHVDGRLIVDLGDDVVAFESRFLCGSVFQDLLNLQLAGIVGPYHHSDSEDLSLDLDCEFLVTLGSENQGVGIDSRQVVVGCGVPDVV